MTPILRRIRAIVAFGFCHLLLGAPSPSTTGELHPRGGCPNFVAKATAGGPVRVAYLGGSITAAEGWRVATTKYLQARYPKARIEEIFAAVPGTGSELGVFRLGREVMPSAPDLVFVEFAVNDEKTPSERIRQTMEGIVRQIWSARPSCDVCFVYTVSKTVLGDLQAGHFQRPATVMEEVADHYGVPSIAFGVEVAKRLSDGRLVFQQAEGPASKDSPLVFSHDGVHPTPGGHKIYAEVIARDWPGLELPGAPHAPTAPISPDNWAAARIVPVDATRTSGSWLKLENSDLHLRKQAGGLAYPAWLAGEAGSSAGFDFDGTVFGLEGIAGPDSGEFEVAIDGMPPVRDTLFDGFITAEYYRIRSWIYPTPIAPGHHHVRITLTSGPVDKQGMKAKHGTKLEDPAVYAPNRLCVCGFLVVGSAGVSQ